MKKFIAVLLALVLCLSAVAFAEETTVSEITWADAEAIIAENGWDGEFVAIEEVGAQIWIPNALLACELSEEDIEGGVIAYFATEDNTAAVSIVYVDADGMTLEEYADVLPDTGATEIGFYSVNGLPCLTYVLEETDNCCIAFVTNMGYILEIAAAPYSDDVFRACAAAIMASIQPVAE